MARCEVASPPWPLGAFDGAAEHAVAVVPEPETSLPARAGRWRCAAATVLALALIGIVVRFAVLPPIVQATIDGGTLQVDHMLMSDPTETSVQLLAVTELHDVLSIRAKMHACSAEIHHGGEHLANVNLPQVNMVPGQRTVFTVNSTLEVVDVMAFTAATAKILQGIGGVWMIKAKTTVVVSVLFIDLHFNVDLDKELDVPPTLLRDVRAFDVDMIPGTGKKDSFQTSARNSFFSSSVLEMSHLGMFKFDLIVADCVDAQKHHTYNVTIGQVEVPDFHVTLGMNNANVTATLIRTTENERCFAEFVSRFQLGLNQQLILKGPVEARSPFLSNVVSQEILFEGSADNAPCRLSLMDKQTMAGSTVKLPDGKWVHYRGTIIVLQNPMSVVLAQEDLLQDVRLMKPLGYTMIHPLFGHVECPVSDMITQVQFLPGMNIRNHTAPPRIVLPPRGIADVFVPGRPLPGQLRNKPCTVAGVKVAGDFDCCFVSLQPALACYSRRRFKEEFMLISIRGSYTLIFEDFRIEKMSLFQPNIPLVFSDEIGDGYLTDGVMTCDMFTFRT